MPKPGYASFSVKASTFERLERFSKEKGWSLSKSIEKCWEEYEEIQALMDRIKVRPETVRRYT